MNMTRKIYMALALAGSLLFASCDNYLDIQPVGKVIPNTLAEYRALLTTVYNTKLNDKAVTELRTDIAQVNSVSSSQNTYGDIQIWNDLSPKAGTRDFVWDSYYTNIYYANAVIDKKDEITEGTPEGVNQLVGEAYLIRAYMHFILVNLYGQPYTLQGAPDTKAVPIKWDLDLEGVPTRSTVKEVYEAILSDIASARGLINQKEWESQYSYRFSTLSVDAMEARVRLYMGSWQEAYDAAERVLAAKPDLEDLNAADAKLPNDYQSAEMITAYEYFSDDVTSALVMAPAFIQKYQAGKDLRLDKYFSKNKDGEYLSAKSGSSQYNCTFRNGEMYLTAAEAAAHLNKLPEARTRLLQLMQKRYTPAGYAEKENTVKAMNQTDLLTEILTERALELAVEGHRWFDLRRTTRPKIQKTVGGKTYVLEENDSRYTLRIPQAAIDANPGLLN
mgnify:CR=1 FL=1